MPTIINRFATKSQWATLNPVLAAGEVGLEIGPDITVNKLKVGNGFVAWEDLPYFSSEEGRYDLFIPREEASSLFIPQSDGGLAFMQKLRGEVSDVRAGLAGDSTGNFTNEWFDMLVDELADSRPSLTFKLTHYGESTQVWEPLTTVQTGDVPQDGVKARDTFARTGAELGMSTPDLGPNWTTDGGNSAGDWTLDGSGAVSSSQTTRGAHMLDMQTAGDMEWRLDLNIDTTTAAFARQIRLHGRYKATTDHIFAELTVAQSNGAVTARISKRIANTVTKISATTDVIVPAIAANTPNQNVSISLRCEGLTNTLTITSGGVTNTVVGVITQSDYDTLYGATKAGIGIVQTGLLPVRMTLAELSLINAPEPLEATFWNSSISGTRLEYQQERIETLFPEPLDVLFVSAGHNYQTRTPEEMHALIDSFVESFHGVQPGVPIIVTGQNPEFAPATNRNAHNMRQFTLKSFCRTRGYGYIDVPERWIENPNRGRALVQEDGIHPTVGAVDTGSSFWRDRVLAYLNSL